jgi:two-component system sensor histidine kinase UhpB
MKAMTDRLKILMLEDSDMDAEIVQRLLLRSKMNFDFQLAISKDEFLHALEQFAPHIILADNSLPQFSAIEALKIVQQKYPHTPFIMVTGSVSEEFAAGIIKLGADDYILKDRLVRLPTAIESAIKQQTAIREKQAALEEIRISNERFQTLSRATKDAVWDWNLLTDKVWWNENFYHLLGYDPQLPVPGAYEWTKRIHPSDASIVMARLKKIKANTIDAWEEEFRFQLSDGSYGTLLDRAYVVRDAAGKPVRAIGALVDITEQKRLIQQMLTSKIEQQKELNRTILQTKEMERNAMGRELHDNINQILASVSLKLDFFMEEPTNNLDIIQNSRDSLQKAINEARNLSHHMVLPRFSEKLLKDELARLIENYHYRQIVELQLDDLQEPFLKPSLKETIYRIVQEQLSNIYKHAKADEVVINIRNDAQVLDLLIKDNGVGFDMRQKSKGIGISNIFTRVESSNGTLEIIAAPGKGCTLLAKIPLQE